MDPRLLDLLAAASGSNGGAAKLYVEDVFSTYLYTGNGSTQTITNGIGLAGKGGMVWIKSRSSTGTTQTNSTIPANNHMVFDTSRTNQNALNTASAYGQDTSFGSGYFNFLANGFNTGTIAGNNWTQASGNSYASWTFREAPKFFDVVTWTGTGSARTLAHNLGIAPGCIIVKRTDTTSNWAVYHRGNTSAAYYEKLNLTDAQTSDSTVWNSTAPTASVFSVGTSTLTNASGSTYVAYLFAHDATADGIIQCGSATCSGGIATINLGWEPQWVLAKQTNTTGDWRLLDNMRGWTNNSSGNQQGLQANTTAAEASYGWGDTLSPTGFNLYGGSTDTFIYIAIRRGPMKTPTSGTSVFSPNTTSGTIGTAITTGFPVDLQFESGTLTTTDNHWFVDRLRGVNSTDDTSTSWKFLNTNLTNAETASTFLSYGFGNTAFKVGYIRAGTSQVFYNFRRAPGFFDEVCYTGTGVARTINHNLGVAPELMIVKGRSMNSSWVVRPPLAGNTNYMVMNSSAALASDGGSFWNSTAPTASVFTTGGNAATNGSGYTYVAYLFASCPGVSKVGSFTGNGSSQTINCGFAAGARFVMIKRTDSTGDWYVWDTARGMVAGNDPHLSLNTTAAEVTTDDSVDTDNTGFIVNQVAATNVNVNGATYIYLAIA